MKDYVPWPAAWVIHHFAFHNELARWVTHDAPCPVATEIGNQEFRASGDGHNLVRVRALLTLQVGACTFELQQRGLGVLREVWRRGGYWSDQDGSRCVLARHKFTQRISIFPAQGWEEALAVPAHVSDEKSICSRE